MRQIIDLTGRHFGYLTVLSIAPRDKNNKIRWHCRCICGKELDILGSTLRNGKVSCGCMKKTTVKDLKGQTFSNLYVIERAGSDNSKKALWKCRCSCGKITIVRGSDLLQNKVKSCGCIKTETLKTNLIGQRFGKLQVLSETSQRINGSIAWLCKCDCGKEILIPTNSLKTGNTQSCGCLVSKGENKIEEILNNNDIIFIKQYKFNNLLGKNKVPLRFDFALFKNNQLFALIEFQGIQHYNNVYNLSEEDWAYSLSRDEQKRDYCKKNRIKLIEIKYDDNIQKKMEEVICELKI